MSPGGGSGCPIDGLRELIRDAPRGGRTGGLAVAERAFEVALAVLVVLALVGFISWRNRRAEGARS